MCCCEDIKKENEEKMTIEFGLMGRATAVGVYLLWQGGKEDKENLINRIPFSKGESSNELEKDIPTLFSVYPLKQQVLRLFVDVLVTDAHFF